MARIVTRLDVFASLDALPADAAPLADSTRDLFASRLWWDTAIRHAMPPGSTVRLLLGRVDGTPVALFPMRRSSGLDGFSTPYTCLYAPALAALATDAAKRAVFAAFGRFCRSWGVVRLDAMDADWADLPLLIDGVRRSGLIAERFDHFGNWHEAVAGLDWTTYLAARPGALRETVRRRLKRAEAMPDAAFTVFDDPAAMGPGIAAFEAVYARSWKDPEPFPDFNAALMRAAAAAGWARIGVWSIAGQPIAAQFWVVLDGSATVLKLAHDEAFKAHSPGTVLTASMLRMLLNEERVTEIDFGRGDDPYKQGWAGHRRPRIGLLLINPWRPRGALALLRQIAGRLSRR